MNKPPLGLMPRIFHDESRFVEVCGAISRAYNEGYKIPLEWIEEYNELIERVKPSNDKADLTFQFEKAFAEWERKKEESAKFYAGKTW